MDREFYDFCRRGLMRRKTYPYQFENEEIAEEFFRAFKQEVPTARYFAVEGVGQFVTYDRRAEKKLCQRLNDLIEKRKKEIEILSAAVLDVNDSLLFE